MSNTAQAHHAHDLALAARHAKLDSRISIEAARPSPNMATIAELKKTKLKIKDALSGG